MKLLLFLLRSSWILFLLSALIGVVSGASGAALIGIIDSALRSSDAVVRDAQLWRFIGLGTLFPVSWVLSQYLLIRFGEQAILKLRLEFSRRILATPLRRIEELGPPRLLASLSRDILTLTLTLSLVPNLCVNGAMVVGCVAYLSWLSPRLFLPLAMFILLATTFHQMALKAGHRRIDKAREEFDVLYKYFQGLTEGIKELQLHRSRQEAFLSGLDSTGDHIRHLNVSTTLIFGLANSLGRVIFFVLIGLMLFLLPQIEEVSFAALTSYTLVLLYLRTPLQSITSLLPQLAQANVVLAKIQRLGLSLEDFGKRESMERVASEPDWKTLELRGVSHSYRGEEVAESFTLGPLDLELRPGEMVFLVGGNGSGKTTLAKLLVGLYIPEEGQIFLDGQPVTEANRTSYRSLFAAVFSEFFLFESLLGLARTNLDDQAREYLVRLRLDHKVEVRDGQLSTLDLSRGQRKRLALLTACLEDRPVYVFDEWAADQDPIFKAFFYNRLLPDLKARGKTMLVITHDERYFDLADRLVKLESGQLIKGPIFHELVEPRVGSELV